MTASMVVAMARFHKGAGSPLTSSLAISSMVRVPTRRGFAMMGVGTSATGMLSVVTEGSSSGVRTGAALCCRGEGAKVGIDGGGGWRVVTAATGGGGGVFITGGGGLGSDESWGGRGGRG